MPGMHIELVVRGRKAVRISRRRWYAVHSAWELRPSLGIEIKFVQFIEEFKNKLPNCSCRRPGCKMSMLFSNFNLVPSTPPGTNQFKWIFLLLSLQKREVVTRTTHRLQYVPRVHRAFCQPTQNRVHPWQWAGCRALGWRAPSRPWHLCWTREDHSETILPIAEAGKLGWFLGACKDSFDTTV